MHLFCIHLTLKGRLSRTEILFTPQYAIALEITEKYIPNQHNSVNTHYAFNLLRKSLGQLTLYRRTLNQFAACRLNCDSHWILSPAGQRLAAGNRTKRWSRAAPAGSFAAGDANGGGCPYCRSP